MRKGKVRLLHEQFAKDKCIELTCLRLSGSLECWKRAFFSLDDIQDNYDARKPIVDEIISSIESNTGTFLFGEPYHGKSTVLRRIIIEELERGYIILSTSSLNANSNQLIHLISALNEKYYRILVVVDDIQNNTLNKEIFKCYNRIRSDKTKFLLSSRKDEFDLLKKSLSRDDVTEVFVRNQSRCTSFLF
jgi:ABC-type dipeptide/oligopeptide/nickel transport system ATPase subunit